MSYIFYLISRLIIHVGNFKNLRVSLHVLSLPLPGVSVHTMVVVIMFCVILFFTSCCYITMYEHYAKKCPLLYIILSWTSYKSRLMFVTRISVQRPCCLEIYFLDCWRKLYHLITFPESIFWTWICTTCNVFNVCSVPKKSCGMAILFKLEIRFQWIFIYTYFTCPEFETFIYDST